MIKDNKNKKTCSVISVVVDWVNNFEIVYFYSATTNDPSDYHFCDQIDLKLGLVEHTCLPVYKQKTKKLLRACFLVIPLRLIEFGKMDEPRHLNCKRHAQF